MQSNRHDLYIVSPSMGRVRFHSSFESLDKVAGFAKAKVSFVSVVNLFDLLGQSNMDDMQTLARQTDKFRNSVHVFDSLQRCDPQSGHSLKLYIGRSCARTCEVQNEEQDEVAENSVDELRKIEENRDEK